MTTTPSTKSRPSRGGYVVAGVVALAGLLAGLGVFLYSLTSLSGSLPQFHGRATFGEAMTVDLRQGERNLVFVDFLGSNTTCTGSGTDSGTLNIKFAPQWEFTAFRDGSFWEAPYELTASKDGRYQITCGADGSDPGSTYTIGQDIPNRQLAGKPLTGLTMGAALAAAGILAGGMITLATRRQRPSPVQR